MPNTKTRPEKNSQSSLKDDLQPEDELARKADETQDQQSTKEESRALWVTERARKMRDQRDQGYRWFGYNDKGKFLNVLQYVEESKQRINSIIEKPDYKDDWQANIFDPVTRDKFIAILSRLSANRMKAQFLDLDTMDSNAAKIVSNLYDAAARGKNGQGQDDRFIFNSMFEAASVGTVVREESYRLGKRKIKDKEHFKKTGETKFKTIFEWEDVWSEIIPIEKFYPGDISKTNIQEMADCAIIDSMDYDTFLQEYNDFPNHLMVKKSVNQEISNRTSFEVEDDEIEGTVEVIKYYNRITDSFDIVANNVLLTPVGNPLPYQHNQLPFTSAQFEKLDNNFFYGMSLPFKLIGMQDMTNTTWNMALDELFISIKTPIFNASGEDIDIDWMYPSNVIDLPKNTDINSVREFKVSNNQSSIQQMQATLKRRMDENSAVSSEGGGVSGSGRSKTAEEVATAREAAADVFGLFLRNMEWAEEDRAEQRVQIMLEKYQKPLKNGKYRRVIIDNIRLLGGELGKMKINITNKPRPAEELTEENKESEDISQVVDISPEQIRNFKYAIKIVPNSSTKDSNLQRKQKELEWFSITSENPIFNHNESAKDLTEAFDKDVSKALAQDQGGEGMDILAQAQGNLPAGNLGKQKEGVPLKFA